MNKVDEEPGAPDLLFYLSVLRKRWWVLAAVVAVGVTASVLHTKRKPKIFQASASVVVEPAAPSVFGSMQEVVQLGATRWTDRQYQQYYNTQVDIVRNYELAQVTVVKNRLWENEKLVPRQPNDTRNKSQLVEAATFALVRGLSASQNRDSRVINVYVRHRNRQLAVMLANLHVQSYIDYNLNLRTKGTGKAATFLGAELKTGASTLRATENELLAFKKKNQLFSVSLEDRRNILSSKISRYANALADAKIARLKIGSTLSYANSLKKEAVLESPIFALSSSDSVANVLKHQYFMAKHTMASLAKDLGPRHPDYIRAKLKVNELFSGIQREANRARRELKAQHSTAWSSEAKLKKELEALKQEAIALGPKTVEYIRLVRKQKSDEKNYNFVLGRLRSSQMSGRNKETNVRLHAAARYGYMVSPRMRSAVALGLVLSLLFGLGLVVLLEFLDRTVKTPEDVEQLTGACVLGVIPVVQKVGGADVAMQMRNRDMWVAENPTSPAAECSRAIRTNLLFASPDEPAKVLTISSPHPQEGKSTTVLYLGTTMAEGGKKVLLIDSDLRRPRLHKSLGLTRTVGLSSLIVGEQEIDDVIKTTDVPNLYCMPCGPTPANPAELLMSKRFIDILDQLQERFDMIILDSPPILHVTDGVVLARRSDGIILVAQAGKTNNGDLQQAARQVRDVNAQIVGVVLNDLNINDRRYAYHYGYAYGYGLAAEDAS